MTHTVAGIILEVSRQLNDQDPTFLFTRFVRWPKIDLLEYLNDAMVQVSVARPDVLITSGLLPNIIVGSMQSLPSYATELISIDYATVPSCSGTLVPTLPLTRVDFGFAKSFFRESCIAPVYRPYNWAYEPINARVYYLFPPVPGGVAVGVGATYKTEVPQYTDPDSTQLISYPLKYHGALVSWMQKRAYEVDQESESSLKLALQHSAEFDKTMKTSVEMDQAVHSGKFLAARRR